MKSEVTWRNWLDTLAAKGHNLFDLQEAIHAAGDNAPAARSAMYRAVRERKIARVGEGFYVIVPPEYRDLGAPPYEWIVEARFARLKRRYYLGLLTAATYHGASHQKPMEIQVVTNKQMRRFQFGGQRVVPIFRKHWPDSELLETKITRTGTFKISCPELTLLDSMRYPAHCAGLDNIASLIRDLREQVRARVLANACKSTVETVVLQRLGWMMARFGTPKAAEVILRELQNRKTEITPLEIGNLQSGTIDPIYRIRVNYLPEAET